MEDQQKLQQILAQLEVYKSQSEVYQTQIDAVQTSLAEIKIFSVVLSKPNCFLMITYYSLIIYIFSSFIIRNF